MRKLITLTVGCWLLCLSLLVQAAWYEGGTLHAASAVEWQQASDANKLATSADLFTVMWQNDHLKPSISQQVNSVDDLRRFSEELMTQLNDAFSPDADAAENARLFTNQQVGETSVLLMFMMGWVKE